MAHTSNPHVQPWRDVVPSRPRRYRIQRPDERVPYQTTRSDRPSRGLWFVAIAGGAMVAVLLLVSYAIWDRMNYDASSQGAAAGSVMDVDGTVAGDRAESAMHEPWPGIDVVVRGGHAVPADAVSPAGTRAEPTR